MEQIVQLKPDDDVASIRARIESSELSHILLVVPRGCGALETNRSLQLLRRAAEDAGVEIGLVTRDAGTRERAGVFGLPVFHTVAEAQRARWHMSPLGRDSVQWLPNVGLEKADLKNLLSDRSRYRQWAALGVVGAGFLLLLCAIATAVVPAASVRIIPASIGVTISTEVLADPSITQINLGTLSIPARRVSSDLGGTAQVKTTTEKSVPNAPSTGTVTFTNVRGEATLVPRGTVVKTSAGVPIRFTTTNTVTIPAGLNARVDAPIQAVDLGTMGNVKEFAINTIEGALSLEARVINLKPTASGTLKPVKVVTTDDKKKLEAQLVQQLRDQASKLLQANVKSGEVLPPDSVLLDLNESVYDRAVDDPADLLNLRITGTAYGLAVDQADLDSIIRSLLQKQMQEGFQLLPGGKVDLMTGAKYQGIALKIPLRGVGYATPQVDTGRLARSLQGKTTEEASAFIASQIGLAVAPDIKITPMGWNRIPWLGFRVAVFVEPQAVGTK